MRSKEDAHDYRYFPDPDLLPVAIDAQWIAQVKASLPPLPAERRARYESLGVSAYDASLAANWVSGAVAALLNDRGVDFSRPPVPAASVGALLRRIEDGTISGKAAKDVLQAMAEGEGDADAIIEKRGLRQISDTGALEAAIAAVLAANAKQVEDYRAGKEKAFNSLVGQVMKATQGKANPGQVAGILKRRLG